LLGVPAPTASGDAFPFGNGVLFVGTETMVSLVPRLRSRFLNPSLLEDSSTLAPLLNDPRFNAATKTKPFLSEELLKELPNTLPARLAPAKITGAPFVRRREDESGRPVSLDTAETEDVTPYTPSNEWLRAFWDVLATSSSTPPGETFAENPFGEWPLVSCESSMLVRVKHVGAVFAPPVSFESNETDEVQSSEIANARFADGSDRLKSDWHWLAPALRAARFPVLDRRAGAACAAAARSAAPPADASFAIRTPADAFVWKLTSASACFAPFAAAEESRGAFPFDFGNASREFKKTMFETLVSQFAASGFSKSRAALEAVKTRLPIFATARGDGVEFILLNDEQSGEYCTCPPDVPFAEASYRSKKTLAYDAVALPLFRALGVLVLDDASLLALHVVPELGRLPIQGRAAALAYVLKHWHRLKDSETLVEALSNARFVDVDDAINYGGETTNEANASEETPPTSKEKTSLLKSPSDLYDPEVELFALTFKDKPNYFPSRAFQSREWLAVLRACGLRSAVDAKLFTECATRVAARAAKIGAAFPLGSNVKTTPRALSIPQRADSRPSRARGSGSFGVAALLTDEGEDANEESSTRVETHGKLAGDEDELRAEVLSAGFALASHLATHASSLYSVAFCETLAGVPFVPAAFGVPGGRAETMRCNVLCAFSQGSLPTHWPVAFMARPTMHPSCVPPAFARSALRVKSGVSAETTLTHLLALGGVQSALRKWPHDCELDPVAAVRASLKAVAAAVADGDFSSAEIETLKRTAFVPVADGSGAFAEAPARLFARAPTSLAPLRHEIPPGLAECLPTLRLLGARETFGPRDAAETLRVAAADAGGRALAPDEVKAAVVALAVAAEGVSVGGKTSGVSRASAGGLDVPRLDVPFAPDRRGVLTPPSALFHAFGAPAWLVSRARASSRGRQEKKRKDTEGENYAEISLKLAHPSVPEETCRLAGIAALADAARERRVVFENADRKRF
jgi:sacsin